MAKQIEKNKRFAPLMIPKPDFNKKDEFEEIYEEIDKLGEVISFSFIQNFLTLTV